MMPARGTFPNTLAQSAPPRSDLLALMFEVAGQF